MCTPVGPKAQAIDSLLTARDSPAQIPDWKSAPRARKAAKNTGASVANSACYETTHPPWPSKTLSEVFTHSCIQNA